MPTIGMTNNGADVTRFLPHSPVLIFSSKLSGFPVILMSVLLLVPEAVRSIPNFLACIRNIDDF